MRRRNLQRLALALGLVFLAVAAGLVSSYRGLSVTMWYQLVDGDLAEARNLWQCLDYWSRYLGQLRLDPRTGRYDFAAAADAADPFERGLAAFHRGDFRRAVTSLEQAIERRGESEERLFWLAISYLRLAEADNCLTALRPEADAGGEPHGMSGLHPHAGGHGDHQRFCILPLERTHDRPANARRAAELYRRLLERGSRDRRLYQWLLNFSAMAAGDFPHAVPEPYLLDNRFIDAFYGPEADSGRGAELDFTDRAAELGVDTFDAGKGVAVEDFDGDGFLDLVTGGSFDQLRFYRNEGGAGFSDRTAEVGLAGIPQPHQITAADVDDDGWIDLFVGSLFHPFRLLRNLEGRGFTDVTGASGLAPVAGEPTPFLTWTSAWGDVDNDGDLDLFVAQWGVRLPLVRGILARPRMDSRLYVNDGGRFSDRTAAYGLSRITADRNFIGAAFGDVDGDGYCDLFLSSPMQRTSVLLHNLGGERFAAAERQSAGFLAAFVDVDHDGALEIFQGGLADARTATAKAVFGAEIGAQRSSRSVLLARDAEGRLEPLAGYFADLPISTMGASYGDLDNDGCVDFYLGTGGPESWFILPNLMYLGEREGKRCARRAVNVSRYQGFGTIQKGHGIVFFDFDNDGDQDVYSSLGGMWPADRWPNQLFVNDGEPSSAWVKIRLRGRRSNRFGVGARIRVVAVDAAGAEIVRRYHMDNKTGFGSAPYLAHVGLLDAVAIRDVEVYWPASGCRGTYRGELRALLELDEADCPGVAGA